MRLSGRIAIVTGAGQTPGTTLGNGRATALKFAAEGAAVMLADRDGDSVAETARMIHERGGEAETIVADVSQETDCIAIISACQTRFGGLDILHNNVGIGTGDNSVTRLTEDAWQRIMDVNLKSMFLMCKHAIPVMRQRGSGSIINISSVAAIASTGMLAYKTSKAGIIALTEHVAMGNAAHGIRANCILPGLINTPMAIEGYSQQLGRDREDVIAARHARVPMGAMGVAEDVANAALFLACDESRFITGVTLPVDGGQSIRIG
ncbi:MAG: SDR family NAD(P)-dependent oxidoreductase [Proteobacteria bacterium]|nr:SDR family NAD(P)-dependent oxidoreductase [Pseudomonadota bacterium]